MRDLVEQRFEACIRRRMRTVKEHAREDIIRAIVTHERKSICIDRLCEAITKAESRCNIGGALKISRFEEMIYSIACLFANTVLEDIKQRALSQAERQRRIDEATKHDALEAEFSAMEKEALDPRIHMVGGTIRKGLEVAPGRRIVRP